MSDAGRESITGKRPDWEKRLWRYIGSGDGTSCPLQSRCRYRIAGGWCPDDNKELISGAIDKSDFNIRNYDFIEGGSRIKCRMCFVLELLAKRYLREYLDLSGISQPPMPAELVARIDLRHNIEVREIPLKAYHGAIWRHNDEWVIQLRGNDASVTKRFTLFHEAFHILAHCNTSPVFRKRSEMAGSFNEMLADHFSLCILMPRDWIMEKWTEVPDLEKMAEIFAVPRSAMCIRLRQLNLI